MSQFKYLFEPITIGKMVVPNRICHVPTDIRLAVQQIKRFCPSLGDYTGLRCSADYLIPGANRRRGGSLPGRGWAGDWHWWRWSGRR